MHFNSKLPITLATDASSYGLGAVLSHVLPHGIEQPIAFASRTLSCSEVNYSQIEKEDLAIIFGIRKFHQYLYEKPFVLVTDHNYIDYIVGFGSKPYADMGPCIIRIFLHYRILPNSTVHQCRWLPLPCIAVKEKKNVDLRLNLVQMVALPLTLCN